MKGFIALLCAGFLHLAANASQPFHTRPEVVPHISTSGLTIIVNTPEFKLRLYRDGQPILESKVIIGREDRQTPEMTAEIQHIILNPYWNVATELARRDILPGGRLSERGYEFVASWEDDTVVSPSSYDIAQCVTHGECPFRVRQQPGPRNFLGVVKFSMPNPYNVYIHDTPSKHLFNRKRRTFSSGCIRTEHPIELAAHILGKTVADVNTMIDDGRQEIYLPEPVKVVVTKIFTPGSYSIYRTRKVLHDITTTSR